ncbi:MAG: Zn-dependent hydrolase, partial [Fimbriimonadaceae bacterium]|nr:Zn-dependent hydrolase [Alphaproteobacteria bacterium]
LFANWCAEQNLAMTVDTMGNMFARRAGTDDSLDPVMVGSHLDTQPTGGKYDGVLGVLGGLELVRTLNDMNIKTRRPIEVVNWTNEEGTRFAPAMVSSGVLANVYNLDFAYSRTDGEGKTQGDELQRIGYVGSEKTGDHPLHSYFELHIEQGPILEDEELDVGVVFLGQGLKWIEITFTGFESHTGSTPMPKRRNALLGAARVVEMVNQLALDNGPHAVGTVGMLDVYPNSRNIIPGRVTFCVDIRSPDTDTLNAMEKAVYNGAKKIADDIGLEVEARDIGHFDPVTFDETCVSAVRNAAERLGYKHKDIVSGAGHDACHIAKIAPTAMIFCPCVDGVSHNEAEEISREWATAGTDVLLHAVLETAEIVE